MREKLLGLKKEYKSIEDLLRDNPSRETEDVKRLVASYKTARKQGKFTNSLLFDIAYWKSQRKAYLCKLNSTRSVTKIFNRIFEETTEKERIKLLRNNLWGVGVPVASAILTIIDPKNYGLIDYKVWQILYLYEYIDHNPKGRNLSVDDWLQYLEIIRSLAKKLKITARDVDRSLFDYHKELELKCSEK